MGRIIRTQLAEAVVGLIISAVLAHFGDLAAFTGLTGTSMVMAVTALAARSAKVVLVVVALTIPFASVTTLEASVGKSLSALAHGPSDGGGVSTVRDVYDKYRGNLTSTSTSAPVPTPTPTGSETILRKAGVEVSPALLELSCLGKECRQEVTISSTGTEDLRLTSMAFEGAGAAAWHRSDDCEYKVIPPDQDCRLRVWAVQSDELSDYTAQLVIHQNTPGPASRVDLTARADILPTETPSTDILPTDPGTPTPIPTDPSQQQPSPTLASLASTL
ncbi:hypothetical protein OHB54_01000 [Streptomyces sp. NBC_01007]|nr:hypothetical protein OHB54_01000 [Streptomyces sp. NBC_01007]